MLYVKETYVNADRNYTFGEGEITETCCDNIRELFRRLSKEYGKCISKLYFDTKSSGTVSVGWVFQKKMQYEDASNSRDMYIREVWVTVLEPCELDDPLALRRNTRWGEEVIRFKNKYMAA